MPGYGLSQNRFDPFLGFTENFSVVFESIPNRALPRTPQKQTLSLWEMDTNDFRGLIQRFGDGVKIYYDPQKRRLVEVCLPILSLQLGVKFPAEESHSHATNYQLKPGEALIIVSVIMLDRSTYGWVYGQEKAAEFAYQLLILEKNLSRNLRGMGQRGGVKQRER